MPLMTLARGCKSTFEGFRAALGLIKDARGLGSENPEQAKAITAALDQAEAGAKVAEAQIAKALGYELCKCQNRNRSQNDHGLAKHQTHSVANRIPRSYALALATGNTGWDGLGDGGAHSSRHPRASSNAANADTTRGGTGAPTTAP
jgi:hypothetical protein